MSDKQEESYVRGVIRQMTELRGIAPNKYSGVINYVIFWLDKIDSGEIVERPQQMEPGPRSVLQEASDIVDGDREETYGHPSLNFQRTAVLWSVVFGHPVTLQQVALAMVCLKIAREVHKPNRDNLVDMVGYVRCLEKMGKIAECDILEPVPGFTMPTDDE